MDILNNILNLDIIRKIRMKTNTSKYGHMDRKSVFEYIYAKNVWGGYRRSLFRRRFTY